MNNIEVTQKALTRAIKFYVEELATERTFRKQGNTQKADKAKARAEGYIAGVQDVLLVKIKLFTSDDGLYIVEVKDLISFETILTLTTEDVEAYL